MYILKLAMVSKIRKQIYIEAEQNNLLKEKARQKAEIIRQAIDRHIISVKSITPNLSAWEREKAFIASLENRPSQPGKRDWQREDLYER